MAGTQTEGINRSARRLGSCRLSERTAYTAALAVGTFLVVISAVNQPYNQNELQQIAPYGSDDISKILHATRQPPLDPLLGALVQHLLGTGQIRQRLVPIVAGIAALALMALLLQRLKLGSAGVFATWVMATTPLWLRYSAYARPYALPLMLMLVFVYAGQRWFESKDHRWLWLVALASAAMPATRIPEPTVFLLASAGVLAFIAWRGRLPRTAAWPMVAIPLIALALIGYPLYRSLAAQSSGIWDPSPTGVIQRFSAGVHEIVTGLIPLLSHYFPWWPITVAVLVAAVSIPQSRRQLAAWWFFWPLLTAPLVFVLAYHFMNPFAFDVRPYRARMAIFFVPPFVLVVAALALLVRDGGVWRQRARSAAAVMLAAVLVGQLPNAARVLTDNEAPDFGQVADVLTEDIPANSIVLYDTLSAAGQWRQPFSAKPRYLGSTPYVDEVGKLMKRPGKVPDRGPVYVLLLDSACASSVVCDGVQAPWDGQPPGWEVARRFDRFTLYRPVRPLSGRAGVIEAMTAFGEDIGPDFGYPEALVAASLLKKTGDAEAGRRLIRLMYERADPEARARIEETVEKYQLNPFG